MPDTVINWIIQGGSLALVALIILWLGPKYARETRDEFVRETRRNRKLVRVLQDRFEKRTAMLVQAIERQTAIIQAAIMQQTSAMLGQMRKGEPPEGAP